jgi:hypothetical protein
MPAAIDTMQLESRLAEAGITAIVYGEGANLVIATEANLSSAAQQQIRDRVAAFRPRRPRPAADLKTAVEGLTATQRNAILARLVAEALQRDPGLARRAGVALDGDEEAGSA